MIRPKPFFLFFFSVMVWHLAGCSTPRETAVLTERPETARVISRPEIAEPAPVADEPARESTPVALVADTTFEGGRMWTFEAPPVEYLERTYGITADAPWFRRAHLGALRFASYCSASLVSSEGLVLTNHHCAREAISKVNRPGERLLQEGFFAGSREEERRVDDLYVDQLIEFADVTDRVLRTAQPLSRTPQARASARSAAAERLQGELQAQARRRDTTLVVEVIPLYSGARYSAYTYKRYRDVRLVVAPETALGFYGGEPDNFTYPRYTLDFTFFRIYDRGQPLQTSYHFRWSEDGARDGEPVFVVGNPGSTSRLYTRDILHYERDFALPAQVNALEQRARILEAAVARDRAHADTTELTNGYFQVANSLKAIRGQWDGLYTTDLLSRRAASDARLQQAIQANDSLNTRYGTLLRQLEAVQRGKQEVAPKMAAFQFFGSPPYDSPTLTRATYGYIMSLLQRNNAPAEAVAQYREPALNVPSLPDSVDAALLAARLRDVAAAFSEDAVLIERLLGGQSPDSVAHRIVFQSALRDTVAFRTLLGRRGGFLGSDDPMVGIAQAIVPLFFSTQEQMQAFLTQEEALLAEWAQARYAVFGSSIPPDASFSLRIADGRVAGYPYNGTFAPPFTTFWGLFDRAASMATHPDFSLPERWRTLPPTFPLHTPLNLVSTNDITGGNSGSPLLNANLDVVGLVFDGNIESLPNSYLFTDRAARTVSVDSRAILVALEHVYGMRALVEELRRR